MICYRDMTFCCFEDRKNFNFGKDCDRSFTKEVKESAEKWWKTFKSSDPVPVAFYVEKPDCFETKEKEK